LLEEFLDEIYGVFYFEGVHFGEVLLLGQFKAVSQAPNILLNPPTNFKIESNGPNLNFTLLIGGRFLGPPLLKVRFGLVFWIILDQFHLK